MRASGLGYRLFSVSGSGSRLFFATADPPGFFTFSKLEKCLFLFHASTIVTFEHKPAAERGENWWTLSHLIHVQRSNVFVTLPPR